MSKTERVFPIDTIGGRIQDLRHKENLSRIELYDLVYPDSPVWSATSKNKTVYNWESGTSELDYQNMAAVCRALNCSSDYLLGLDECTNKTTQFIHDQTGLAESSIDELIVKKDKCSRALDILFSLDRYPNCPLFTESLLPLMTMYYYMCYRHISFTNEDNDLSDKEVTTKSLDMYEENQVCQYRISKTVSLMIDKIREMAFKDYAQTKGLDLCPNNIPYNDL